MDPAFWEGKRVLLTGHTGFKGGWLVAWLHQLGAQVCGISLPPGTEPSLANLLPVEQLCESHICDIRDAAALSDLMSDFEPEIVFNLAAQALVRESYDDPLGTFDTNVMGSANLLNAVRDARATKCVVMATTDKVYRNEESNYPYRETDRLGGHDPYSASKAASEIIIESYRDAFLTSSGVGLASARAGNVIGGGDWSKDRLLPDAVRAWQSGGTLSIRSPQSIRPWQHVLEPLAGYLTLAQRLFEDPGLAGAYNFGPETNTAASVQTVIELARYVFDQGRVEYSTDVNAVHESERLQLEIAKSREVLKFTPRYSLNQAVERTMRWYLNQIAGGDALELCLADIADFQAAQ